MRRTKPSRAHRSARVRGTWPGPRANTPPADRGRQGRGPSGGGLAPGSRAPTLASDGDQFAMLAPREAKPVADLADRRVRADRVEDRGHQVPVAAGGRLEAVHRSFPGRCRTLRADPPDPLDLAAFALRVDPLERRGVDLVVQEAVDADDDLVARLDRLLDAV